MIGGKSDKMHIGILVYPGVMRSALYGIQEMLAVAIERQGAPISSVVEVSHEVLPESSFHLLFIPPSIEKSPPHPSPGLLSWLQAQHKNGCVLASACAGVFILAPTGLLDGKSATTHWLLAERCKRAFPSVNFSPERMLIDEGDVVTAGGISAWMDLTLALIGRFFGSATAIALGKYFLLEAGSRKQSYFSCFTPVLDHKDGLVLTVQYKLEQVFAMPLSVSTMASWVHVSPRTLQRRFQAATRESPIRYLQKLRLSKAQEKLENSQLSIEQIVIDVGYEDLSTFRKLFHLQYGLSPSRYRQRFSFQQRKMRPE